MNPECEGLRAVSAFKVGAGASVWLEGFRLVYVFKIVTLKGVAHHAFGSRPSSHPFVVDNNPLVMEKMLPVIHLNNHQGRSNEISLE